MKCKVCGEVKAIVKIVDNKLALHCAECKKFVKYANKKETVTINKMMDEAKAAKETKTKAVVVTNYEKFMTLPKDQMQKTMVNMVIHCRTMSADKIEKTIAEWFGKETNASK